MEAQIKLVNEISTDIGITNKQIINRAMEYLRRLKMKTNFKTKNEYPRIVLCLDISATQANETIDFDKGLKLSKYGQIKYRNEKNTILSILDIEAPNIESICIALKVAQSQIKDVEKNVFQILEKLKKSKANLLGDIRHPQNACMAVYHSCKLLSVAVDERKLIDISRLQRKQWTQLKSLWRPWLDKTPPPAKNTKQNPQKLTNLHTNGIGVPSSRPLQAIKNVAIESYDVWKKRILEKAYADLAKLKPKSKRLIRRAKK